MNPRLSLGLGLLFSWLLGPWWLVLILALIGLAWYGFYLEGLLAAFLLDIFGSSEANFFGHPFGLTLMILGFLIVIPFIRARLYTR